MGLHADCRGVLIRHGTSRGLEEQEKEAERLTERYGEGLEHQRTGGDWNWDGSGLEAQAGLGWSLRGQGLLRTCNGYQHQWMWRKVCKRAAFISLRAQGASWSCGGLEERQSINRDSKHHHHRQVVGLGASGHKLNDGGRTDGLGRDPTGNSGSDSGT